MDDSPRPLRRSPRTKKGRAFDSKAAAAATTDAAETLIAMNSPEPGLRDHGLSSSSRQDSDLQLVSLTKDKRGEAVRKAEKWALKERREASNRVRYEKDKIQMQTARVKRATESPSGRQRQDALKMLRRQKYKERIRRRETDEKERFILQAERARRAEQAAGRRRLERRKNLVSRLSSVLQRDSVAHEMKVESLVRGDPLFVVENAATGELIVQFSVDHLTRLQPEKWLNQEIVDWYLCLVTNGKTDCLSLGAEFHRQLLMKNQGPEFVIDFHRPVALRGVDEGQGFCALESTNLILVPANPNGNHWVLLAIYPKQRRLCCFDSLSPGPKGSPACQKIAKAVLSWVALHEKRRSGTMDGWTTEMVQGIPRQGNTWDCGIHVCDFARMLTLDPPGEPSCVDEETTKIFRARLLVYALETALVSY